jgi:hypothetical protein
MGALLKERARKPIISPDIGIVLPTLKQMDGVTYYVVEIREPWREGGYQIFQTLLTEKEMLNTAGEWLSTLARARR